jgi:hypothetical protein
LKGKAKAKSEREKGQGIPKITMASKENHADIQTRAFESVEDDRAATGYSRLGKKRRTKAHFQAN